MIGGTSGGCQVYKCLESVEGQSYTSPTATIGTISNNVTISVATTTTGELCDGRKQVLRLDHARKALEGGVQRQFYPLINY
jgi:hypothetical protein